MIAPTVRPIVAFTALCAVVVLGGVIGASRSDRSVVEITRGPPVAVRVVADARGFTFIHPDGTESRLWLQLPVNRELDIVVTTKGAPRTLRVASLGLEVRAERGRTVHARWIVPRRYRRTKHAITCAPACADTAFVLGRYDGSFDPVRPLFPDHPNPADQICPEAEEGFDVCWGRVLHRQAGCFSCHSASTGVDQPAPSFAGLWGTTRSLEDGRSEVVDAAYIRRAILQPQVDIVRGYTTTVMNPYRFSDRQLLAFTVYIKSLATPPPVVAPAPSSPVHRRRARVNGTASSNMDSP